MSNKKDLNIEFLRTIAILSVILIHMSMDYYYDSSLLRTKFSLWWVENIYYTLTRFCVPVFFIISAWLAFNCPSQKSWSVRLQRLVIPWLIWSAFYYLCQGGHDFADFLHKTFTNNTAFHLWFLPAFIGYSLCLPAMVTLFSAERSASFRYLFWALFLFSILFPSLIAGLNFFYGNFRYLEGIKQFGLTVPPLLLYACAFPYLYRKLNHWRWWLLYLAVIAINMLINMLVSKKLLSPNEYFYGYTTPLVFFSSYLLFNLIMAIDFSVLPERIRGFITACGRYSFGIYLSHWAIFMLLRKYGLVLTNMPVIDPLINTLIVFSVSFLSIRLAYKIKPLRPIL